MQTSNFPVRAGDLLCDTPGAWQIDPIAAFDAFVGSVAFTELSLRKPSKAGQDGAAQPLQPLRASSAKIYRHMWNNFVRWSKERQVSWLELTPAHIRSFLDQEDEEGRRILKSATIRRQYLTLLERVYRYLAIAPNPATQTYRDIDPSHRSQLVGRNADTVALSELQKEILMAALEKAFVASRAEDGSWQVRRNIALQALMLGGGVKVSEALGFITEHVGMAGRDDSVPLTVSPISVGGLTQWHTTFLRPFATPIVLSWVLERKRLGIPGKLLFPATEHGGRLNKSTVYRHTKRFLADSGIDVPRRGGRTLRNTFAAHELDNGHTEAEVGYMLGHRSQRAIEPYVKAAARLGRLPRR